MPLYEYKCCKCNKVIESIEKVDTEFIVCECGYIANKVMSVSNFSLKGHCWEKDGYSSKKKTVLDNAPK